ncbi:MAG: double-strand break repair helicase AddA [Pseudomonadota bacterium]
MSNDATRAQIDAALPQRSTWLSANAGSGKTRVLTDRVALLLLGGTAPQHILCLTYTKAAASEMQNRLFKRLGAWAMMDDAALTTSLRDLGVAPGTLNSETLRKARVLFAKAIEAPGGLKIQTIHSFCAALLRRFPLEAQVSPAFTEMDERAGKQLRADLLDRMSETHPDAMRAMSTHFTGEDPDNLLSEIIRHREALGQPRSDDELHEQFNLAPDMTPETLISDVFAGQEDQIIASILPALDDGKDSDQKLAHALRQLNLSAPDLSTLSRLEALFLSGAKTKTPFRPKSFPPTKPVRAVMGPWGDAFDDLRARVADARDTRLALMSYARTRALTQFALPFLQQLDAAKLQRGWLDFDDLIRKARTLLTDQSVAAWVLFRLDGGIDHILVDEAQDTSPMQWDVIRLLSEEFFTGEGASDAQRTLFVVGDKKQSIYSFQGADPAEFDRMRAYFETRHAEAQNTFAARELLFSFRSAAPILQLVDAVFTDDLREGMGERLDHRAFRTALPGKVDLWPWTEGEENPEEKEWYDPVDTVGQNHPSVLLADKIAKHILHQINHGQITETRRVDGADQLVTRRIRPGDFLILVQSRSAQGGLFHEIIRACKKHSLPMAGADRLRIGAELGVRDLISLLSFLETPQDDLALAEIMRSPLGNLSEQDLFKLAYGRDGTLWQRLDAQKKDHPALYAMLNDLRDKADFMRPYDLIERALTQHHGRARLLARLGLEAEEGIAALLDQALTYEQFEAPTLTGFLSWLASDEVTIKRQIDSEGDMIRVMTVHGAKGLEAPIVILPQTGTTKNTIRDDILTGETGPIWKAKSGAATTQQTAITDEMKRLDRQENMRLLYVALTRAESQLIICGAGKEQPNNGGSWYEIVENGLLACGAEPGPDLSLQLNEGNWPEDVERAASDKPDASEQALPEWALTPAAPAKTEDALLSPSTLGGAKILPGPVETLTEAQAKARGTMIHSLLEHLSACPKSERAARASQLLDGYDNPLDEDLPNHALRVLETPELSHLFAPTTLAEVAITATLPELENRQIQGFIDRLVVTDDTVLAVDFKSNHIVPTRADDTPDGILRQMGAYAAALAQIYPNKRIETAILWTETATLMPLTHEIVRDALLSTHIS